MNSLNMIQNIAEANTVLILLALVAVFVIAFKVLEMVFQTILVSALSGGFYLALTYLIETIVFDLDSLIFFTFIGGTLYTVYSLATKGWKLASISAMLPVKIFKTLRNFLKKASGKVRNSNRNEKEE